MTFANLSSDLAGILLIILLMEITIGAGLFWRLHKAKSTSRESAPGQTSLTYLLSLLGVLFVLIITVTIGGILAQMDRPFYAAGGATSTEWTLSPAHYIIFLTCYPVYLMLGALTYLIVKQNDPLALPTLRWSILLASLMPMMFIPAVNGELLDNKTTPWETVYLGAYQVANIAWIALGLLPIGLYAVRKIMSGLSE